MSQRTASTGISPRLTTMGISPDEMRHFSTLFAKGDQLKQGAIPANQIWRASSKDGKNLTLEDFCVALRLVAIAQAGIPFTPQHLTSFTDVSLPEFQGIQTPPKKPTSNPINMIRQAHPNLNLNQATQNASPLPINLNLQPQPQVVNNIKETPVTTNPLQSQVKQSPIQISSLPTEISVDPEVTKLHAAFETEAKRLRETNEKLQGVITEVKDITPFIDKLKTEIQWYKNKTDLLETQMRVQKQQLQSMKATENDYRSLINEREQQQSQQQNEIDQAIQKNKQAITEQTALIQEKKTLLNDLNIQITKSSQELSNAQSQGEDEKMTLVIQEIEQLTERLLHLENIKTQQTSIVEARREQLNVLNTTKQEFIKEKTSLQSIVDSLITENNEIKEKIKILHNICPSSKKASSRNISRLPSDPWSFSSSSSEKKSLQSDTPSIPIPTIQVQSPDFNPFESTGTDSTDPFASAEIEDTGWANFS